jgi:hypothetical protein
VSRRSGRCGRGRQQVTRRASRDADKVVEAAKAIGRPRIGTDRDDVDAQASRALNRRWCAALVFAQPASGEQPHPCGLLPSHRLRGMREQVARSRLDLAGHHGAAIACDQIQFATQVGVPAHPVAGEDLVAGADQILRGGLFAVAAEPMGPLSTAGMATASETDVTAAVTVIVWMAANRGCCCCPHGLDPALGGSGRRPAPENSGKIHGAGSGKRLGENLPGCG